MVDHVARPTLSSLDVPGIEASKDLPETDFLVHSCGVRDDQVPCTLSFRPCSGRRLQHHAFGRLHYTMESGTPVLKRGASQGRGIADQLNG